MQAIYQAIKDSIEKYMNVDDLRIREQQRIRGIHDKFTYNMDTVEGLIEGPDTAQSDEDME